MERKYKFREILKKVHKNNIRNSDVKPTDEFEFPDFTIINLPENSGEVLKTAVFDFADYLFVSMNISARVGNPAVVNFEITDKIGTEFDIDVTDKIYITASNERSAAQALFYLEDLMNEKKAPIIAKGKISKKLEFSPRITATYGFGNGVCIPDEFFAQMAHHGFNAVMMGNCIPGDQSAVKFIENSKRALKWGLDIYCCAQVPSKYHPDDPEAKEYYANTYGEFIKKFPFVKGIILVGEAIGFPSKDPNTSGGHRLKSPDNIPLEKPDAGFYPCEDYYKLVNIIKESTMTFNPEIDIVLWTYNWWGERILLSDGPITKLIENLPTDISLLVTFDLSEQYKMDGVTKFVCDYSISRVGPSDTFRFEADLAKKKGIRLYSHVSTSGSTWDFGTVPYMPMPQKWIKRYKAIYKAKKEYGLAGFIENWTPGFYPSIVSELTKKCYFDSNSDFDQNLKSILKSHFGDKADTVYKALELWSEASDYIHSTYDNQYGPLRVGTAYPLCLISHIKSPNASKWANFFHNAEPNYFNTPYPIRLETDKMHWEKMASLMKDGSDILASIENPSEEILRLENLGRYLYYCAVTVINVHRWHKHRELLKVLKDKKEIEKSINELKVIAADERQNALDSIDCLRKDSRLGYEPCDDYLGGEDEVLWKIKHLDYVVNNELKRYEIELPL